MIDMTGMRFGRWVVIGRAPNMGSAAAWICRCDCGTEAVRRGDGLRRGSTTSCGCGQREAARVRHTRYGGNVGLNCLVNNYRNGARERGIAFALSHEDCHRLFLGACHYCATPPAQEAAFGSRRQHKVVYNGIDRVDNAQDYTPDNVVSCCKTCNSAKGELTVPEFKAWVERVHSRALTF